MPNLSNNTSTLQSILETINNLPEQSKGLDTSDATATEDKIFLNETAYVNGEKITGTFSIDNEVESQENLISQIMLALDEI